MKELSPRLQFWAALGVCWAIALLALYVHLAFWALFGVVLIAVVLNGVRNWK